jgi:uncharacterized membrane protein YhiD involved in acid resistance
MASWLAALGVGIGVTAGSGINLLILVISLVIPIVFITIDAIYASIAQDFRSRRNEITYFMNTDNYIKASVREKLDSKKISLKSPSKIYWFDFQGNLSLRNSIVHKFKRNLIVKLTRFTRICFYGFQIR